MFAGMLITLREGIEAFLIVGILIGILAKMGQRDKYKYIWAGAVGAVVLSIGLAYVIQFFSVEFEGVNEIIFELLVASLAVAVLTYMVIWMHKQSRYLKQEMEKKVKTAVSGNQVWALVFLAFVSVIREGIETVLFLSAVAGANQGSGLLAGAVIGLVAAAVICFLIGKAVVHLDIRKFFVITGTLIAVIAGGLVAQVVHEAHELGLSLLSQTAWDLGWLIPDESLPGKLLRAFFGYRAAPTILQILVYVSYTGGMLWFLWKGSSRPKAAQKAAGTNLVAES